MSRSQLEPRPRPASTSRFAGSPTHDPHAPWRIGGWFGAALWLACAVLAQLPARAETAFFEFGQPTFHVSEEAAVAQIDIRRWGNTTHNFSVDWFATSGTAAAGVDFTGVTNTLFFASGETNKIVTVPLRDDGILEEAETVLLRFGFPSVGASTGLVNQAALVIHDNELPSLLDGSFHPSLEPNNDVFAVALQGDGRILVGGEFTELNQGPVSLTRSGIARFMPDGEVDFTFAPGNGVSPGVYALAVQADGKILVGGGFNSPGSSHPFLSRLEANGTLDPSFGAGVNDEVRAIAVQPDGEILIAGRFTAVNGENHGRIARLHVDGSIDSTFLGGEGANNNIRVLVRQDDGRLLIGGQFTSYDGASRVRVARLEANGTVDLAFNPGAGANGQVRAIAATPDGRIYLGGDFTAYDSAPRPGLVRVLPGGTLDFEFYAALQAVETVRSLLVQPDGRVLVGGSFEGAWGKARSNLERCLTNGAPDPTLLSDRGPDDEVFALALQEDGAIVIGGQFHQVASVPRLGLARLLPDSRIPAVEYAAREFFATEASSQATIQVRRTGESSNAVTATCYTMAGTAGAGTDFTSVTNTLQFAPLQVTRSFTVPIFNEGAPEPPETVRLLVTDTHGVAPGAWGEAQLVILDGFGNGSLQLLPPILYEEGDGAGFLVIRTGPTNLPLVLQYRTRDGTARAGTDYEAVSGVFQLSAGETSGYIQVRPINDSLPEGPEDFWLELRETPGGPVILSSAVTIIDNEIGVGLLSTEVVVQEDVGTVTFYVQCQWDPVASVEVDYTTREIGSALAGLDYAARAGTMTFQRNGDVQAITVPILNDGRPEGPESFTVVLTGMRGGPVWLGETNAIITILDNDAGLEFVTQSVAIGENEGQVTLAVRRRDDGGNTVTVEYATLDGQATAGHDYTASSGTLILPPGPGERTFSVSVLEDPLLEIDETFRVFLRNPTAGAGLGDKASAVVRVLDNERPGSLETWFNPWRAGFRFGGPARLAVQPDGKILSSLGPTFVRFNANGELDATFRSGDVFFGTFVPAVQPDGRIVIGATSSNSLGDNQCVFRLLSNGSLDSTFVPGVNFGHTTAVVVQRDGRILVGGNYDESFGASSVANNGLLRLRSDGSVDPTFNPGTFLPRGAYFESPTTVETLILQSDGRILVGGKFTSVSGRSCDRVIRLNSDGTSDPSFFCDATGAPSNIEAAVLTMALQPDGKVLAGGIFTKLQGVRRNGLTRLTGDGQVDTGFEAPFGPNIVVRALQIQPDGKILVGGGHHQWPDNGTMNFVVRLRPDGALDETFDPGIAPNAAVTDLALLQDGDVLVAGGFTTFNGVERTSLVRLNGGTAAYSRITLTPALMAVGEGGQTTLEVQRGGETNWATTVEVATVPGTATPGQDFAVPQPTLTFAPGETRKTIDLLVFEDGLSEADETLSVMLSIPEGNPAVLLQARADVTILDQDRPGTLDLSFAQTIDVNSEIEEFLVLPDGRILIAGNFSLVNGVAGPGYARLNPDGTLDHTFQRGTGSYDTIRALTRQSDGRILIGGDFKSVLGQHRIGIARLLENGAVDASFQSSLDDLGASAQSVGVIALVGTKILIGGEFSKVGGQERFSIARLLSDGTLDPSFNTPGGVRCGLCGFDGTLRVIAPLPNGQILIGGGFSMVQSKPRRFLARLNSDGSLDNSFPPGLGPNGPVTALVPLPSGQFYVAGGFTSISGAPGAGVVRLEPDGTVSPNLPPRIGPDGTVTALALQPDGRLLIGGYFRNVNGVPRARVARLRPDLTLDESFDAGASLGPGNDGVSALGLQTDGHVLVGGYFSPATQRNNVARLRGWFSPRLEMDNAPATAGAGLKLFTQPGETYTLEASMDLVHWISVQTIVASGTTFELPAPGFAGVPHQFYRARQVR